MLKPQKQFTFIGIIAFATLLLLGTNSCSPDQCEPCKKGQAKEVTTSPATSAILIQRAAFWDTLVGVCFSGGWTSDAIYITNGKVYADFVTAKPGVNAAMIRTYNDPTLAAKKMPGIINSCETYPTLVHADSGAMYYKIVPKGDSIIGSYSVYYVSESQKDWAKAHPAEVEQKFGLPLASCAASYDIYTITSLNDSNLVFEATIAPTEQYWKTTPAIVYSTTAGGIQSLVLNNSVSTLWHKSAARTDSIVPTTMPKL